MGLYATDSVIALTEEQMAQIDGGRKIADWISGACTAYGGYAVIAFATGVGAVGAGTVGAFCAGWAIGTLIF